MVSMGAHWSRGLKEQVAHYGWVKRHHVVSSAPHLVPTPPNPVDETKLNYWNQPAFKAPELPDVPKDWNIRNWSEDSTTLVCTTSSGSKNYPLLRASPVPPKSRKGKGNKGPSEHAKAAGKTEEPISAPARAALNSYGSQKTRSCVVS